MTKAKTTSGEAEVAATAAPQPEAPGLDLNDLAQLTALVQMAVKRGTFEMEELESVLAVHKKVSAFLRHQAQMQAAAQDPKAATEGEG